MNKIKLNAGLGTAILLGSFLCGWETLLIVTVLMLLFCEVEDSFKGMIVRLVTFMIGYEIVSTLWSTVIMGGFNVITDGLDALRDVILSYDETADVEAFYKINQYLINPIDLVLGVCDSIVYILLVVAKISLVLAVVTNRPMKENVITKKINEYVTKIINYVNSIDFPAK